MGLRVVSKTRWRIEIPWQGCREDQDEGKDMRKPTGNLQITDIVVRGCLQNVKIGPLRCMEEVLDYHIYI